MVIRDERDGGPGRGGGGGNELGHRLEAVQRGGRARHEGLKGVCPLGQFGPGRLQLGLVHLDRALFLLETRSLCVQLCSALRDLCRLGVKLGHDLCQLGPRVRCRVQERRLGCALGAQRSLQLGDLGLDVFQLSLDVLDPGGRGGCPGVDPGGERRLLFLHMLAVELEVGPGSGEFCPRLDQPFLLVCQPLTLLPDGLFHGVALFGLVRFQRLSGLCIQRVCFVLQRFQLAHQVLGAVYKSPSGGFRSFHGQLDLSHLDRELICTLVRLFRNGRLLLALCLCQLLCQLCHLFKHVLPRHLCLSQRPRQLQHLLCHLLNRPAQHINLFRHRPLLLRRGCGGFFSISRRLSLSIVFTSVFTTVS